MSVFPWIVVIVGVIAGFLWLQDGKNQRRWSRLFGRMLKQQRLHCLVFVRFIQ
jgi:hypothetical protein